jgi:hypothetical protein
MGFLFMRPLNKEVARMKTIIILGLLIIFIIGGEFSVGITGIKIKAGDGIFKKIFKSFRKGRQRGLRSKMK